MSIQITLNAGRTLEMKRALYKRIAERLAESPGIRKEDVLVNLVEVSKENWSFGNGEASLREVTGPDARGHPEARERRGISKHQSPRRASPSRPRSSDSGSPRLNARAASLTPAVLGTCRSGRGRPS